MYSPQLIKIETNEKSVYLSLIANTVKFLSRISEDSGYTQWFARLQALWTEHGIVLLRMIEQTLDLTNACQSLDQRWSIYLVPKF